MFKIYLKEMNSIHFGFIYGFFIVVLDFIFYLFPEYSTFFSFLFILSHYFVLYFYLRNNSQIRIYKKFVNSLGITFVGLLVYTIYLIFLSSTNFYKYYINLIRSDFLKELEIQLSNQSEFSLIKNEYFSESNFLTFYIIANLVVTFFVSLVASQIYVLIINFFSNQKNIQSESE